LFQKGTGSVGRWLLQT